MHGYNSALNVHTAGITRAQKCVHGFGWEHSWELLMMACPHRPLCFKKIRTTTTTTRILVSTQ